MESCTECGGAVGTKDVFCRKCGANVSAVHVPVSNVLAWWIAFTPLLGLVAQNAIAVATGTPIKNIWWISYIITIGLCWWDTDKVQREYPEFQTGSIIYLIPVYLFKRAKLLKHSLAYFFVWLVAFAAVTFIPSQYLLNNSLFNFGLGSASAISTVKDSYLDEYPGASVGGAIDKYLDGERWTSFTADSGAHVVEVTGTMPGIPQILTFQFLMSSSTSGYTLNYGEISGRRLSIPEIWGQLQTIYSKIE